MSKINLKQNIMKKEAVISSGNKSKKQAQDLRAVESMRAGDKSAFEFIYSKYGKFIRQYCYKSFGNTRTSEDLVQEIMAKVYVNIDKYNEECTFNAWVWKIAKNHVVDYSRRQKGIPLSTKLNFSFSNDDFSDESEMEIGTVNLSSINSGSLTPEDEYVGKQRKAYVSHILSLVSDRERRVIEMYYFENKSYKEISDELNIGMSLTQTSLHRAKEKLKRHIGELSNISDLITC